MNNAAVKDPRSTKPGYALILLTLVYIVSFMDRQILAILQDDVRAEFGLSDTQLGLLTGFAFAFFYATLGIPIGRIADRANRVVVLCVSLGLWSAMTILCGVAGSFLMLFMARVGVGIGEAGGVPTSHSLLADFFDPQGLPKAMGIYSAATSIGAVSGLLVGGVVADLHSWRTAFIVAGIPGLVLVVILLLTLKEPPRGRYASAHAPPAQKLSFFPALAALSRVRIFWPTLVGNATAVAMTYAVWSWSPTLLGRAYDVARSEIVLAEIVIIVGGGFTGILAGGWLTATLGRRDPAWRARIPMIGAFASVPPYIVAFAGGPMWVSVPFLALGSFFTLWTFAPSLALIQSSVAPDQRAFASSLALFISNVLGMGLGPVLIGTMSDRFPGSGGAPLGLALSVFSLVGLLGGVALYIAARAVKADGQPA